MDAVSVVRNRVAGIAGAHQSLVNDVADLDWAQPVRPGTSPIGLTLWHVPRTQDWLVHTCIRGTPEVADQPEFGALPDPDTYGFGTGLTPDQAREAARWVRPESLLAYAEAVRAAVDQWLEGLTDTDLDRTVPSFDARQHTRPSYSTPEALSEVSHLGALSVGMLLLRPAISHLLMHLGEVETLAQVARGDA